MRNVFKSEQFGFFFSLGRSSTLCLLAGLLARTASGQAPGLLWTTNVGATLFAVDEQTNVYANAGGSVILLSGAGVPLRTNSLCPLPGLAHRDSAGSIYFAGTFPVPPFPGGVVTPVDFGGVTLSNGMCFIAKYSNSGGLVWAQEFGPRSSQLRGISIGDFQFDPNGNAYVGYTYNMTSYDHSSLLAKFDTTGSNQWTIEPTKQDQWGTTDGSVRLGPVSDIGGYVAADVHSIGYLGVDLVTLSRFGGDGSLTVIANWNTASYGAWLKARPVANSLSELYNVETGALTKRSTSAAPVWTKPVGPVWALAPDQYDGLHVGDDGGGLSRFDFDGNVEWTMNLSSPAKAMLLDAYGNRFLSLDDGTVTRMEDETLSKPVITNGPSAQTVLAGTDALLSVGATGTTPFRYFWLFNGNPLSDATNVILDLPNMASAQSGQYSVIVSNFVGSVTSAPALVRVKMVEFYLGDQALTNGNYVFYMPPTLTLRSAYANGQSFYTLDGTVPSFASKLYSGPFTLPQSATVRAIGYSADFLQSEEADAVNAVVLVRHTLAASASGGGTVNLNPPGGDYLSTNVVSATAVPSPGWSFLYWLGDASGTNPNTNISMEHDKALYAVFGTTLSTTVAGNGQVLLDPPGGLYPYGATVRLTGLPQSGNYFGAWGNAASGNTNPLHYTVTSPSPTVSSIFGAIPSGQAALTVSISGRGQVGLNPRANVYPLNQTVTITATPEAGQTFLNWSGDTTSSQNPLMVTLDQSRVITANFSSKPALRANRPGIEGLTPVGFRFTILSDPQTIFQVMASTNLSSWLSLGPVTNILGEVQFTDPEALSLPARSYKLAP